jgi:hypothetical protein
MEFATLEIQGELSEAGQMKAVLFSPDRRFGEGGDDACE